MPLTNTELDQIKLCIDLLKKLCADGEQIARIPEAQFLELSKYAGMLSRPDRMELKRRNKAQKKLQQRQIKEHNRALTSSSGIRKARLESVFIAPGQIEAPDQSSDPLRLKSYKNCYVCKKEYSDLHHFYDSMCKSCGDFNYAKRFQHCDLSNRIAMITGSRLKIGYHATLKLLRSGAEVIATTRFPIDSATRYAKETDFEVWKNKLHIYGLDLRHIPSVEIFCKHFSNLYSRLDILINNAAQTVRRPPGFFAHLMAIETTEWNELSKDVKILLNNYHQLIQDLQQSTEKNSLLPDTAFSMDLEKSGLGIISSAELSQIPYKVDNLVNSDVLFPSGQLDADLQQVDLRKTNSWRLKLGEIETAEMIEVQLVNAIAPFVLNNHLIQIMKRENTGQKHIVNVSAMEGKFYRFTKAARHPHTNMAKAALNMMTHTAASDLIKYGIFMNAVDTGWVTDEDPAELAKFKTETHDFQPPLDIVDGAARICDPFIDGILTGQHWNGKFLKDYMPIDW